MPLISVITPTQAHAAEHLPALWGSLAAQALPAGWELEWLVQEDGPDPSVAALLPLDDPRVHHEALGQQLGGPTTRNVALGRARGDVVAGMDHDDLYEPGGLAALLEPLVAHADVGWSCGRTRWLMEDGATWEKPDVLAGGRVAPGAVASWFVRTDDFPFPAAMAAFRRDALVAHGGWPAVARSADAVLLAALGDRWPGWWVDRVVAVYRRWAAQRTVQPDDLRIRDLPHVRGVIAARRAAEEALAARRG